MSLQLRLQKRIQHGGWSVAASAYEFLWNAQQSTLDQSMLVMAAPAQSERVIDVACGAGALALACADKVGRSGQVLALDGSPGSLTKVREHAATLELHNVACEPWQTRTLPCADASHDLALCVRSLATSADPARVLAELHRVLRPGGRLAVAAWGGRAQCAWSAAHALVEQARGTRREPIAFRFGAPGSLSTLVADAGFQVLRDERLDYLQKYDSAETAFEAAASELDRCADSIPTHARERIAAAYTRAISPWKRKEGYRLPAQAILLLARKPLRS